MESTAVYVHMSVLLGNLIIIYLGGVFFMFLSAADSLSLEPWVYVSLKGGQKSQSSMPFQHFFLFLLGEF